MRYAINEKEVTFRVLDDGAVLVHCETGYYYTLNATGTLLQALRRDRPADWIGAALILTAAAYVNQIALLFWPMIAACAPAAQARGALRRLIVCIGVAGGAFLLWVAALPRAAFFANSFLPNHGRL